MTLTPLSRFCIPLLCLLGASLTAHADALNIKPGLWEHQTSMKSESGQLEEQMEMLRKQMESMPAAQKKMMKDMLAKQGMTLDFSNQTMRDCLTEEEAAQGEFDWSENTECDHEVVTSGDETRIEFTCPEGNVEGEMVLDGDSAYTGKSTAEVDMGGTKDTITITHNGRWLSADCP